MLKIAIFAFGAIISLLPYQNAVAVPNLPSQLEIIGVYKTARITCYNDFGATASGEITRPGIVATSDRSIPMGTEIYIEGYGIMEIKDKTNLRIQKDYGLTFDIWDKECDKSFGVKHLTYKLLK